MTKKLFAKRLIMIFVTLAIFVGLIIVILTPAFKSLLSTRLDSKAIVDSIDKSRVKLSFLNEQNQRKDKINDLYARSLILLPESSNQADLILQLTEISKLSGVTQEKLTISPADKNSTKFLLQVQGSYQSFLDFVKKLQVALRVNKLSKIQLSLGNQSVKAVLEGQAFNQVLPSDLKLSQNELSPDIKKLDQKTHFGEPINASDNPSGSIEPFGQL